jgi:hypothetical protein
LGFTQNQLTRPYAYHQFDGSTRIGEFVSISETLADGPPLPHHQTFLAELITKRPDTNAVALWADAKSIVSKGRVWGGFISARSGFASPTDDSQLIGLEIDVLNAGKPGVFPNDSKVGLQIVGFGNRNTNAIEILNEQKGEGEFENGINFQPGAISKDGAIFGVGPQSSRYGLNLLGSRFSEAAVIVSENQKIVFRAEGRRDASIYRDEFSDGHLVLTAGPGGMRVTNAENTSNLLIIHPDGKVDRASLLWQYYWPWFGGGMGVIGVMAVLIVFLFTKLHRLERHLEACYLRPSVTDGTDLFGLHRNLSIE